MALLKPVISTPIIAAWSEPSKMMKTKHIMMQINPIRFWIWRGHLGSAGLPLETGCDNDDLLDDSGGRLKVLYGHIMSVPKGCVHKAHTDVDDSESEANACANYSLHLTHAIEVQPPFE